MNLGSSKGNVSVLFVHFLEGRLQNISELFQLLFKDIVQEGFVRQNLDTFLRVRVQVIFNLGYQLLAMHVGGSL